VQALASVTADWPDAAASVRRRRRQLHLHSPLSCCGCCAPLPALRLLRCRTALRRELTPLLRLTAAVAVAVAAVPWRERSGSAAQAAGQPSEPDRTQRTAQPHRRSPSFCFVFTSFIIHGTGTALKSSPSSAPGRPGQGDGAKARGEDSSAGQGAGQPGPRAAAISRLASQRVQRRVSWS
jgi:hypothetical protein